MPELFPLQYDLERKKIDQSAVRVLEIISGIENSTTDARMISQRLKEVAESESALTTLTLQVISGIFQTIADSVATGRGRAAGFDANTAYYFASPAADPAVKEVLRQLVTQGIGDNVRKR